MSVVQPQPVPDMGIMDWAVVFAGLTAGVALVFKAIDFSAPEKRKNKCYNLTNFWLVLSGVIHVSTALYN